MMKREVIVHTQSGRSFRGVLWRRYGPWIVLRQASLITGNDTADLEGDVWVDRRNLDFMQVVR